MHLAHKFCSNKAVQSRVDTVYDAHRQAANWGQAQTASSCLAAAAVVTRCPPAAAAASRAWAAAAAALLLPQAAHVGT